MGFVELRVSMPLSLLLVHIEHPILIDRVVQSFLAPESHPRNVRVKQIVDKLKRACDILTGYGDRQATGSIQFCGSINIPLIFHPFINRDRERNVITTQITESIRLIRLHQIVIELPPLIHHSKNRA